MAEQNRLNPSERSYKNFSSSSDGSFESLDIDAAKLAMKRDNSSSSCGSSQNSLDEEQRKKKRQDRKKRQKLRSRQMR